MTFLPIVERELRITARLPATYRNRTITAGVVMFVALAMLVFGRFTLSPSRAGRYMFRTLSFLALLFCALEGVRKTSDCLSEEKREGTLGLLFLTDLKGYDVVFGKLAATSLNSVYGLFAILPVLALPMLVGGVTQTEYWRMVLALANILFFSLCTGMVVSAGCRQENRAMAGTLFALLAVMLLPLYLRTPSIAALSPSLAYCNAFAASYPADARGYWQSLGIAQSLSWLMLFGASAMLPRWWQDAPVEKIRFAFSRRTTGPRLDKDSRCTRLWEEMLAANPAFWLAARHTGTRFFLWWLVAATLIGALFCLFGHQTGALFAVFGVINFVLKMRVASRACHCLAEARRNNALEMLLSTPLTVNQIIHGQILALQRIFLRPAVAIFCVEAVAIFARLATENGKNATAPGALMMVLCTIYFAMFLLDVVAVTWAGMWFGLSAKNETEAITKTILLVLVLPYAAVFLWCFGTPMFLGIPIFWIAWCSSKLKSEFRAIAANRYVPPSAGSGWLSKTGNQAAPPIIVYPAP